jgi:hypothetical protein
VDDARHSKASAAAAQRTMAFPLLCCVEPYQNTAAAWRLLGPRFQPGQGWLDAPQQAA